MLGVRIKNRRKQLRITQKELGQAVGKGESTISEWESEKRSPDVDLLPEIAAELRTSVAYLMGWSDDPDDYDDATRIDSISGEWYRHFNSEDEADIRAYRAMVEERAREFTLPRGAIPVVRQTIPLLGGIHAGEPTYSETSFDSYIEAGADIRCDFALRVVGDSMINARILDGDIVFIRKQDTVENGEIAAVLIDDETTLKRVRFLPGGMTMFMPENPSYQPIIVGGEDETRNVRILGKAIAFQSNVR